MIDEYQISSQLLVAAYHFKDCESRLEMKIVGVMLCKLRYESFIIPTNPFSGRTFYSAMMFQQLGMNLSWCQRNRINNLIL